VLGIRWILRRSVLPHPSREQASWAKAARGAPVKKQDQRKQRTNGFLVVAPGLTMRDRLRVLQPHDRDSYYASRKLVRGDMLGDIKRAKIVINN
jgi:hypothetical protein